MRRFLNMARMLACLMVMILVVPFAMIPSRAVHAAEAGRTSSADLVVDQADLLTDDEEDALRETLEEISARQQMDVAVVTTDDSEGKTAEEYADDFYDYNGYGYGDGNDGILLLVAMDTREWHITTTGAAIDAFMYDIEIVEGSFLSDLSVGNYYDAFDSYARICDDIITSYKEGTGYEEDNSYSLLVDKAALLSDGEEAEVLSALEEVSTMHGVDVAVYTTNNTNGMSAMDYADDLQDSGNYQDDCVLLLLAMDLREWYIATRGTCIDAFSDSDIQEIGDAMLSDLGDGDYAGAFKKYAKLCDQELTAYEENPGADDGGSTIHTNGDEPGYTQKKSFGDVAGPSALFGALASFFISLIQSFTVRSGKKGGLVSGVHSAREYLKGGLHYTVNTTRFIRSDHIRHYRPKNRDGGSGGGHIHTGSSGISHGGGGGSFGGGGISHGGGGGHF